jgi:hypothetical protein
MTMMKAGRTSQKGSEVWTKWLAVSVVLTGVTAWSARAGDLQIHAVDVPFVEALWQTSGHADKTAEAFNDWNDTNPPAVPANCARCHSSPGYQDYLGADGSAAGVVDKPAAIGTTVDCAACHNAATASLSSVTFPSGVEVKDLGAEARCMVCHQGRSSKVAVDDAIKAQGLSDPNKLDTTNAKLRFLNIHYNASGATLYGGTTKGGYQYDGKSYDVKFAHVDGLNTCVDCHDSHSLDVRLEHCAVCHAGVQTREDLKKIRMVGSTRDYDGDGDALEGIAGEIEGLQASLYQAIQACAAKAGAPIVYDSHSHPYFFKDTNGNGQVDPNEAVSANQYGPYTPRLLKATYNYQVSLKDPGAFAHNAKYIIQLLFDSIEDLDAARVATLTRDDAGHFAGANEQWRHWDVDGKVPGSCSKCHSADGLPFFLQEGVTASQPLSNGMQCTTCHNAMPEFTRHEVKTALFPSGAKLDTGEPGSNLCISCHQGRESTVSLNAKIAGLEPDTVSNKLTFSNVHYFAAGATLFGTQAKGAYEYAGKTYQGRLKHVGSFDTCTECHEAHTGELKTQGCSSMVCHGSAKPANMRKDTKDFDGDNNRTEGLSYEIAGLTGVLYATMRDYAATVAKTPIVYDSHTHPYFFKDTNGNGQADPDEVVRANGFAAWTPRLLCAAYNYQYAQKDPGAYAHNGKYLIQVLHDSIADLGTKVTVSMTKMVRP